jgi:hypothetical protein
MNLAFGEVTHLCYAWTGRYKRLLFAAEAANDKFLHLRSVDD